MNSIYKSIFSSLFVFIFSINAMEISNDNLNSEKLSLSLKTYDSNHPFGEDVYVDVDIIDEFLFVNQRDAFSDSEEETSVDLSECETLSDHDENAETNQRTSIKRSCKKQVSKKSCKKHKHECDKCEVTCTLKNNLNAHREFFHKICRTCDQQFKDYQKLQNHINKSHNRQTLYEIFCTYCAYSVLKSQGASRAMMAHINKNHA